jgi:glycosyltransferase involved in cell wall biosynthesis
MKLLIVVPALGSVYGGTSKTVIDLAKSLVCKGISVDIATTDANGKISLNVPHNQWLLESGYRIRYFRYVSLGDYKWSNAFAIWLFNHVSDYNIVHSNAVFSLCNVPAHWACQFHNVPYVMTPHGMLEPWALSYKAWKKKIYYKLLERAALNKASAIQALASPEAKHIHELQITSPIVLVPNGIHRQDFETLPSSDLFYQNFCNTKGKNLILFLGRIDPKKGLDLLAVAFSQIRVQFPDTHLVIAGPDNIGFLSTAKAYFTEVDCAHAVTFTGILSGDLKQSALAAATIYIAPSYSEGFSMSVLEGMASGIPCIITTGCNFPEAKLANIAHVVDINSNAIAKALADCLENPTAAKVIGERARQLVFDHYTWDKVSENLVDIYTAILKKQPLPKYV